MTGIIMNPVSDDEVEHRRVKALANTDRVDQAVSLFRDQHARLVGESMQMVSAGQPAMTPRYMVTRSLMVLAQNGFTKQEILEMLAR